ncbi:methyltransferase domain-containing protein [Oscillatoria sp. HE19RPO]|uniref:methyltransferase domain-containing protein n=1 Tax=Oscillatoria sp. HE19RPO TaxID=2954806 RepID=UPI0020C1D527|nr:methyltransferase domain-containing protein [Oscillatoria sp. HE19RPO]
MTARFTEAEVASFYASGDNVERCFGDLGGYLHWGYFPESVSSELTDLVRACERWNEYMLTRTQITSQSRVLDVGCGNGNTAIWLARQTGCEVVGIDISAGCIERCRQQSEEEPSLRLHFERGSATDLPFESGSFTHVWSQAALFHLADRPRGFQEIQRVLQENGIFVFDDLVMATESGSSTQQNLRDRLRSNAISNTREDIELLAQLGLVVLEKVDLSSHLKKSYEILLREGGSQLTPLAECAREVMAAIDRREMGWWFYQCQKISDRLPWIHDNKTTEELRKKYDAWAPIYDADLEKSWVMPTHAVHLLQEVCPDREIRILDAGAGTGKVGEALAKLGYKNITAFDLSEEMLEVARKKQVYTALYPANLEEPLTFCDREIFDAIAAIGVFTYGHASPAGLSNLLPLLKPGGIFIVTVRASNQPMQTAFEQLSWQLIRKQNYGFDNETFYVLAYKKIDLLD